MRAGDGGTTKMNASEMALLRTKLREVNIEYSAQVRKQAEERRFARMGS